ncbi:MAG: hypothetical protein EBS05_11790 [Proteobacteria bacterium]|nr:hypothetical protein [Pseudomonadota bacterium]
MTEENRKTFINLINEALICADEFLLECGSNANGLLAEYVALLKNALNRIKAEAASGTLRPADGMAFGFTRWLDEWAPLELYCAVVKVERYFLENL